MKHIARSCSIRVAGATLLTCLIGVAAFGTTSDGSVLRVPWDASTPLTWDLFRCVAPPDAVHRSEAAAIHMTIRWHASYSVTSSGGAWTGHVKAVTVTNTMEPSLSWFVPGKADDLVLRHEQAHFDLNEVYRRKLATVLPCVQTRSATKEGAIDGLHEALHRQADEILKKLQDVQARYDAESGHGNNPSGQAHWEAQIAAWLLNPNAAP